MSILLSFIPWWGRVLVVIALCTALFGAGYIKGVSSESAKFDAYKLSQAQQTIEIQAATIAKQTAMQRKKDEAIDAAQKRAQQAQAATAALRSVKLRLRLWLQHQCVARRGRPDRGTGHA